jgi:hypothetical protein
MSGSEPRVSFRVTGISNLTHQSLVQVIVALLNTKKGLKPNTKHPLTTRLIDDDSAIVNGPESLSCLADNGQSIAVSRKILQPIINRGVPVKDTAASVTLTFYPVTAHPTNWKPMKKRKYDTTIDLPLHMSEILAKIGIDQNIFPIMHTYKNVKFRSKQSDAWSEFLTKNEIDRMHLIHAVYLEISRDERIVVIVPHATAEIPAGRVDLGKFPPDVHFMKIGGISKLLGLDVFVSVPWGLLLGDDLNRSELRPVAQRTIVDSAVLKKDKVVCELGNVGLEISGEDLKRLAEKEGWEVIDGVWRPVDLVL